MSALGTLKFTSTRIPYGSSHRSKLIDFLDPASGRITDDELLGQGNGLRIRSGSESKVYPRDRRESAYGDDVVIQYVGYRLLRPVTPSEGEPCHRGRRLGLQESELCRMAEGYVAKQSVQDCLNSATTKERDAISSILLRVNHEEAHAAAEWKLVGLTDEYVWSEELGSAGKEFVMILRKQRRGHAWTPSAPTQATKVYSRHEPPSRTQPIQIGRTQPIQIGRTQPIQIRTNGQALRPEEMGRSPMSPGSKSPVEFPSLPQASRGPHLQPPSSWTRRSTASSLPIRGSRSATTESQISSHLNRMGAIEEGVLQMSPTTKQVRFAGAMPMPRRNTDPTGLSVKSPREEDRLRRDRQQMRARSTRATRASDAPTKLPELEFSDLDSHATEGSRRRGGWTSGENSPPTPVVFPSSPQGWKFEGQTSQHFLRSNDRRQSYDLQPGKGPVRVHTRGSSDEDEHYPRLSRQGRMEEEASKIVGLDRRLDRQLDRLSQDEMRREDAGRRGKGMPMYR